MSAYGSSVPKFEESSMYLLTHSLRDSDSHIVMLKFRGAREGAFVRTIGASDDAVLMSGDP